MFCRHSNSFLVYNFPQHMVWSIKFTLYELRQDVPCKLSWIMLWQTENFQDPINITTNCRLIFIYFIRRWWTMQWMMVRAHKKLFHLLFPRALSLLTPSSNKWKSKSGEVLACNVSEVTRSINVVDNEVVCLYCSNKNNKCLARDGRLIKIFRHMNNEHWRMPT